MSLIIADVGGTIWDAKELKKDIVMMTDEDELAYASKLLNNRCYREWWEGVKHGRVKTSQLRSRLSNLINNLI